MMDTLQRFRFAAGLALLLVSLAYLVQIASPLRLVGDGVDYLLQASSALTVMVSECTVNNRCGRQGIPH